MQPKKHKDKLKAQLQ